MNGYDLHNRWFEFTSISEGTKPIHTALFTFICHLFNRLHWPEEIGLPSYDTINVLGVGNYRTYKNALEKLEEFGFIEVVSWSKNQYTSTRICFGKNAISQGVCFGKNEEANQSALAKLPRQRSKQRSRQGSKQGCHNKTGKNNKRVKTGKNNYVVDVEKNDSEPKSKNEHEHSGNEKTRTIQLPTGDEKEKKGSGQKKEKKEKTGKRYELESWPDRALNDEVYIEVILKANYHAGFDGAMITEAMEMFLNEKRGDLDDNWTGEKDFRRNFRFWISKKIKFFKDAKPKPPKYAGIVSEETIRSCTEALLREGIESGRYVPGESPDSHNWPPPADPQNGIHNSNGYANP